jgi:AraC family transcriptional regulator
MPDGGTSCAEEPHGPPTARGGLAGWQVRRIRALSANGARRLTVRDLAVDVGLSAHHFSRAFRTSFGAPPSLWLAKQRLARAMELLTHTRRTVDEIAVELGYSSGSQFARAFRRHVGESPLAFRRR